MGFPSVHAWVWSVALASVVGCSSGDGEALGEHRGAVFTHEFSSFTLEPGFERDGLCQSWTLGNTEDVWLSEVHFKTDGGYHHSNWLFVPDELFPGPDGAWDCDERGYTELEAALSGGVLYAQATQDSDDVQRFPDGAAVLLPAGTRIIGGTHQFNTTPDPITTSIRMEIHTIPERDVAVRLNPFRLSYRDLAIPPRSKSSFTAECDFSGTRGGADMDLYYVMPHYHALGSRFELQIMGGARDGEQLFEDFGENTGRTFDPPLTLDGATGVRFTCEFENPGDKTVGWGIGDQEMCVMLGFARSDLIYDGGVETGSKLVDAAANAHAGPCEVLALPGNFDGRRY